MFRMNDGHPLRESIGRNARLRWFDRASQRRRGRDLRGNDLPTRCFFLLWLGGRPKVERRIPQFFAKFVVAEMPIGHVRLLGQPRLIVPRMNLGRGMHEFHFLAWYLHEKRARHRVTTLPAKVALHRIAQLQFLFRAGDPHERQPAFLFHLGFVVGAALVRQQTMLDRHQKDDGELQPLGRVQRHQRDFVALGLPIVGFIHQPGIFQIDFQLPAARVVLIELPRIGQQFFDIRQPIEVFLVVAARQVIAISRFGEHRA